MQNQTPTSKVDVLCVGHAAYDLIFSVTHHPQADEKLVADNLLACGGGPAANAAVGIARLGYSAAFVGYLGTDIYGAQHYQELSAAGVNTQYLVKGSAPTPLSTILVKPNGQRALINYKGTQQVLAAHQVDVSSLQPKVLLFDGHEPALSLALAARAKREHLPTVLDAGSVHAGTLALLDHVDYLACSEKFALQYAGDINTALMRLAAVAPHVIITLGERGILWRSGGNQGQLGAFAVEAIDTTGAGDAFHGALAAAIAAQLPWETMLRYASAAGALCCTVLGARHGLPTQTAVTQLLQHGQLIAA